MDWSMTKTYDRSDVSCDLICSVCSLCVFLEYDRDDYIYIYIYSHTASVMNEDYEERIDISYVTEKIRQWDEKDSIEIGSFHGRTALIHKEKINGKKYNTYLYQEKGALRELMVREGLDTTTMQGEKIVAVKDFSVIETKQLYHIEIQGSDGKIYQNCVYRHSRN